jgi:hypothetical protein
MQPGETITPGSQNPTEPSAPVAPPPQQQEMPQAPLPVPPQQQATPQQPLPEPGGWQFNPGEPDASNASAPASHMDAIAWTASEYVAHDKNAGWFMLAGVATVALAAAVYLITRDVISTGAMAVVGFSFAAFAARKPQVLQYAIDNAGVHIGQKMYPYGLFRTFSVLEEGAAHSILLMPMQRFNLPISIYYDPKDEDKIVETLGSYLPHELRRPAAVDNFMRKIHF